MQGNIYPVTGRGGEQVFPITSDKAVVISGEENKRLSEKWEDFYSKEEVNQLIPNPNLLDNSNFEINQRGNESYTDGGFITYGGPDRWKQFQSTFNVKTKLLSKNGAGGSGQIFQLIPLSERGLASGDTVTASLYVDGTLYSGSGEVKTNYPDYSLLIDETDFSVIIGSQEGLSDVVALTIQCNKEHPETIKIEKVELEKGNVATPWQPKGYGAELAECLRYYQCIAFSVGQDRSIYKYTPTLVPMRINPTYTLQQIAASGTLPIITTAPLYFTANLAEPQYYDGFAYLSADL